MFPLMIFYRLLIYFFFLNLPCRNALDDTTFHGNPRIMSLGATANHVASPSTPSPSPLFLPLLFFLFIIIVIVEAEPTVGAGSGDDGAVPLVKFDAAPRAETSGAGPAVEPELQERVEEKNREEITDSITVFGIEQL